MSFFFFFQAEDGIRDGHVTGVQTCALPIWRMRSRGARARVSQRSRRQGVPRCIRAAARDRKSVVEGKSVDLGGGRIIKKKKSEARRSHRGKRPRRVKL